jgi:hypothetical protein
MAAHRCRATLRRRRPPGTAAQIVPAAFGSACLLLAIPFFVFATQMLISMFHGLTTRSTARCS